MKDTETKLAFIKARAEGKSYSTIQKELGIAKGTCTSWEQSLRADIEAMKTAHMEELYTAYNMKREARISSLGGIIDKLDGEISTRPLEDLSTDKLLELRLKYYKELREEYVEPAPEHEGDNTLDGLLEEYNQLFLDSKTGKYSPADIKAQLAILDGKRATMIKREEENQLEEHDPFNIMSQHKSGILRHEA